MDFNGLDLLGVIAVFALAGFAACAFRRHRQEAQPLPRRERDDLALARAVRASYDNLPYRNGRGWSS